MPQTYLLDGAEWRAFRLFLIDREDRELDRIHRQLRRECATRQENERDSRPLSTRRKVQIPVAESSRDRTIPSLLDPHGSAPQPGADVRARDLIDLGVQLYARTAN